MLLEFENGTLRKVDSEFIHKKSLGCLEVGGHYSEIFRISENSLKF